ncbi:hypothetical protein ACIBL3_21805 [Kribbella sp. NPDC050124]|uniref:hypothetical protein n=1 Tax=Kribbella sp. NPDC050124 TaxID=3364114 RepID=UPI0037B5560D
METPVPKGTWEQRPLIGQIAAVSGALALAAVVWAGVLTFSSLDPPQAIRIAGLAFLPLGIGVAAGAGAAGRHGASRPWALLGIALAATAVVALIAMQFAVDY